MAANEYLSEQCDEIVTGPFSSKNWLKPAGVALSKLDQVKPSVYNVGLTDFRELRATAVQGRVKRTESNTELSDNRPEDLCRNAWSSSTSIPDLMKQHNVIRCRPESAKQPPRVRPPSGKKMRPQSAKDSLSPLNDSEIKVKGAKYDPSSRPPKCSPPQLPGWIDHHTAYKLDPQPSNKVELPGGYHGYAGGLAPPPSPRTNQSDERIAVDQELDSILREYSNAAPGDLQIRRRTTPETIHFSLPNVLDEDEEDDSDFDTERLIREAEMQIKRAPRQAVFHRKPGFSYVHADVNKDGPMDNTKPVININTSAGTVVNGSHKPNVKFVEKDNVTVEITPRNSGKRVVNNRLIRHGRRDLKYVKSRTDTGLGNRTFNAPKAVDCAKDLPLENVEDLGDTLNINFARQNGKILNSNSNERIAVISSFADADDEVVDKARITTPVASVFVNYDEDCINDEQFSTSQKSFSSKSRPQSGTICKSTIGKNYYELLRNEDLENNRVEENCSVFKTTTTIELTDDVESQEIKTRNVLEVQEQHPRPTSAPRRPLSGHRKTKNSTTNKGDNSNRPGSRLGFVATAPSNSPPENKQSSSRTGSHDIDTNISYLDDHLAETNRQSDLSDFDESNRQISETSFGGDTPARGEIKTSHVTGDRKSPGVKIRKYKASTEGRNHSIAMRKQRSLSAHALCHGHSERSSSVSSKHNLQSHERPRILSTQDSIQYNKKIYDKYTRAATSVCKSVVNESKEPIIYLNTRKPEPEYESEGIKECKRIQERLSEKGVSITIETLKRALLPPGGRNSYYEIDAGLPRNPTDNLLSGPQTWLPEEFKRLKLAEKTLARTKLSLYYQKLEEDRLLRQSMSSAAKKKKKRKGKKRVVKKGGSAT